MTPRRLHLDEHGSGSPVLVLPGLTFPAASWTPVRERAGDGARWLVVDLPGVGGSAPWDVVTPAGLVDALHAEVTQRELPPPLVVGHSYSVLVAVLYAAQHPVRGLVTVDQRLDPEGVPVPAAGLPPGSADRAASGLLAAIRASLHAEALDDAVAAHLAAVHRPDAGQAAPYLRALEGVAVEAFLAPVVAALPGLRVPWTDVHRQEPGQAHRARVAPGRASVQVWPSSSHCLHLEQPDRFARLVEAGATDPAAA